MCFVAQHFITNEWDATQGGFLIRHDHIPHLFLNECTMGIAHQTIQVTGTPASVATMWGAMQRYLPGHTHIWSVATMWGAMAAFSARGFTC